MMSVGIGTLRNRTTKVTLQSAQVNSTLTVFIAVMFSFFSFRR